MKAAILREPGKPLSVEEVQIDKPKAHEVLIRTAACGLCHSDLHFINGSYPHPLPAIPGHEAACLFLDLLVCLLGVVCVSLAPHRQWRKANNRGSNRNSYLKTDKRTQSQTYHVSQKVSLRHSRGM